MPLQSNTSLPTHASGKQRATDKEWASLVGEEDPIYRHTLYEAKLIFAIWLIAMIGSCTYCYLFGYSSHPSQSGAWGPTLGTWAGPLESFNRDVTLLKTPGGLGIPDWVFYGIALPWIGCIVATLWFCLFVFHDDDLGEDWEQTPGLGEASSEGETHHG